MSPLYQRYKLLSLNPKQLLKYAILYQFTSYIPIENGGYRRVGWNI